MFLAVHGRQQDTKLALCDPKREFCLAAKFGVLARTILEFGDWIVS